MGKIKILNKGLLTSIQDLGRRGYQKCGVPISGVMDDYSHKIANILVDNTVEEATLEVTMLGPKIQFLDKQKISITGGNLQPKINNKSVPMWETLNVEKEDVLSFSGLKSGLRSYIAFSGGFDIPKPMGSKSYYSKANLGKEIKNNQILKINTSLDYNNRRLSEEYIPQFKTEIECRVVLGPQDDYFAQEEINIFFKSKYNVSNASDRMGYRLEGNQIKHKLTPDIISDGLGKGAIQIPGNGEPIIMMSDAQTTGGYTKIGYVIKSDLNKLAQLKPGDQIQFKEISIEEAQGKYIDYMNKFSTIEEKIDFPRDITHYKITINGKIYDVSVEDLNN